jgi:hypothetical protein
MRTRNTGPITESEKSHHLVRRLGSKDAEERRIAKDEFLRMATDDPALFHADLADIIKAITGNRKRTWRYMVGFFVSLYPLTIIITALTEGSERIIVPLLWTVGTLVAAAVVGFAISQTLVYPRRKRLAEAIGGIDDLNALPALIELLEFTNPAVQDAIMPPITRLLSRVRTSDAYLLGFIHRTGLARVLSTPRARKLPASFFVSVLQAFEQIGDSQVLPTVSWLAQGKGAAADHPTIQEAAQTCLTHLQEQLRRHQAPYLLLRPSSLAEASHALLRPVVNAPDSAPHELLRADNSSQGQAVPVSFRPQEPISEILPIRLQGYEDS